MSHLEEKERELTIKSWCREIGLDRDEAMLLVDVCLEESEEIPDLKKKQWLLQSLEDIYIREAYPDKRVQRLCLVAKKLYIKLSDMKNEDVGYIMENITDAKESISGVGGMLDSFWIENEIEGIKDKVIQNVCRARHLAFLQMRV